MSPSNSTKNVRIPDKFHGVDINSANKYHMLLKKYIMPHKIYHRITTAAVRQPHQKILIRDFTPNFKNSGRESRNLIREHEPLFRTLSRISLVNFLSRLLFV